jgi:hypothetical protein
MLSHTNGVRNLAALAPPEKVGHPRLPCAFLPSAQAGACATALALPPAAARLHELEVTMWI